MKAATSNGVKFIFQEGQNELIYKDVTVFRIEEHERLYYLKTVNNHNQCVDALVNDIMSRDKVSLACDVKTWHEIMGAL